MGDDIFHVESVHRALEESKITLAVNQQSSILLMWTGRYSPEVSFPWKMKIRNVEELRS